ncbi:translation initiation factor IF-2 [Niameybacter massiliensis]|uniref:Translation initiation factor IF-2 n=1 Tax=Holtiella tumoricola TaxID=3018743 RepID=A0AA42DPB3_9FIRM|nr:MULTISPECIES: translation initiation factor IF-2 [Lachnospirales]MDA3732630.1 translation initiation factor IF-2 [Holtiella tumoricola]
MSKVRVYEIAKQLDISTKEILDKLKEYGFEVHSHMSSLQEDEVNLIMEYYAQEEPTNEKKVESEEVIKPPTPTLSELEKAKETLKKQEEPLQQSTQIADPRTTKERTRPDLTHQVKSTKGKNKKKNKNKKLEKAGNMGQQNFDNENKNLNEDIKVIEIPANISIRDLADKMNMAAIELIKNLMKKGKMATINQEIDFELAAQVAEEFDIIVELEEEKDLLEEIFKEVEDKEEDLEARPPVVVVMGHVDHGKTSLLDAIRSTHVTTREAGGITQHIGASTVTLNGKKITFLDTPGHEAFTAMRMRGAQVTDIAILVVAADDGVMPQTIEAINHARAAGVEIIVAINKMDKQGANPDRVKQELADQGLLVEDWGGDTICVPVSAVKGEGLDNLLEMVLLVAEMNNYKANPNCKARGTIVEAQLDKGRGPVATVLVQRGTLKVGDPIVAGCAYGRIRAMVDDKGRQVKKAGPSTPVEILGLSEVPVAGDMFYVANSDKQARQAADKVKAQGRLQILGQSQQKVSLDDLYNQIQEGQMKELNLIVKADVQGSVEAVKQSLERLSNEEVRIRIIHGAVGAITESDLMLASASGAIIIGFNVRPDTATKAIADREEVDIRLYRVIYNAIEDIKSAMKGMLDPEFVEKVTGHIEVRQTFKVSGVGTVAGGYVLDGKVGRHSGVRIVRDGIVVYEGKLASLKRFKDDVKEVNTGYECGLMFERFNDIKEGDIAEAFIMEEVPR